MEVGSSCLLPEKHFPIDCSTIFCVRCGRPGQLLKGNRKHHSQIVPLFLRLELGAALIMSFFSFFDFNFHCQNKMEKRLTIATHISPSNFLMILPHLEQLRKLVFFGMPSATVRKPDWPMVIYVDGHSSCSLCHIILFILSALYWLGKKNRLFLSP